VALGSAPAFTGLFARAFSGERLQRRWFAATGLACAGVTLITLGGGDGGDISAPGIGLALAAGAGYAGYAVAGKRLMDQGATPEGLMAAVFGAGALVLSPVLLFAPLDGLVSGEGAALAVYLGAFPTAVAYVLFARGLKKIGPSETSTLTLAEPVTAMLLGFLVLSEQPGLIPLVGAVSVLAGLGVLAGRVAPTWRTQRQPSERRTRPRRTSSQATSLSASG
jgi:DME family drug/metabolite transporter